MAVTKKHISKDNGYKNISGFYDTVLGHSDDNIKFVKKSIRKYNKSAKSVFEFGCGTGNNLLYLSEFYDTEGVDISGSMLKIAAEKVNRSILHKGDIRNFIPSKKQDVVICLYDTINHLLLFNEWKKVFKNVFNSLNENGLFIFDFNTFYKLDLLSEISPIVNRFEKNFLIADINKISANTFNWNLKVFEFKKDDDFKLYESNIKESSFELKKITDALEKHFEILETADEFDKKVHQHSERIYIVCRKKNLKN